MITIDPGLNGCGVANWPGRNGGGGELVHAFYIERIEGSASKAYQMAWTLCSCLHATPVEQVIIERPRIYTKMKGDPADILNLLEVGATLQGMLGRPVEWVEPHAWKGSLNADAMTERIKSRLTPEEHKRVEPCAASLMHNVYDAVGIGLHALGRLDRKRVIAR